MRLKLLALFVSVLALAGLVLQASAGDTQTINATVTALNISLTISGGTPDYGTHQAGDGALVPSPDHVVVTNNGTGPEDFLVKGADSVPAGWTLDSSSATTDHYVHRFGTGPSPTGVLTTSNQALIADVAATTGPGTGEAWLYLTLDMPQTITSFGAKSLPVTVTAMAH
jgi:hypothetical protein